MKLEKNSVFNLKNWGLFFSVLFFYVAVTPVQSTFSFLDLNVPEY